MSVRNRRIALAAVVAATAIAVPTAALASGSGSPPAGLTPSPHVSKSATTSGRTDRSVTGPLAVATFAAHLGVSSRAAEHALRQLSALSGNSGIDPASPAFAAMGREVDASPAQLAAALDSVKQSIAGQ